MREVDDCDQLVRSANPLTAQRSDVEVAAALDRMTRMLPVAPPSPARRPKVVKPRVLFLLAAVAGAGVFAGTNIVWPSSGTGGVPEAWAKQVIGRVSAVLSGPQGGILYINCTLAETRANGRRVRSFKFQTWEQQTRPYAYWQSGYNGTDHETTVITDRIERYDAASNTLNEGRPQPPRAINLLKTIYNPAWLAVSYMAQQVGIATNTGSYGVLLARLLQAPGVAVTAHAHLRGRAVIAIVSGLRSGISRRRAGELWGTLFVDPTTYRPLEYVIHSGPVVLTQTFLTYRTLRAGSVPVPNLRKLHPDARIARRNG